MIPHSAKEILLTAICLLLALEVPVNAQSWKTIHTNEYNQRYQIDLQSIIKRGDLMFANMRQLSYGDLFAEIELEVDCDDKIQTEEFFLVGGNSPSSPHVHFMQENREWWTLWEMERGGRCTPDSTSAICKTHFLAEKYTPNIYESLDNRLNKFYSAICRY